MTTQYICNYTAWTPEQRQQVEDWLRLHNIDPQHTPVDAAFLHHPDTDEWAIEQFAYRDGKHRIENGAVVRHFVRRAGRAPLPWPA